MNKILPLIFFMFICSPSVAQELGNYQNDSIYKQNKVKVRKWYSGTNKKLTITTSYDTEGRLSKYNVTLNLGATEMTTYYSYDANGKLINQVDTIRNGKPDKKELKRLKKMGFNPKMLLGDVKNKPALEVAKYDLIYEGDELIKRIKYNPDGSLDIVDSFQEGGKLQKKEWYRNGNIYRESTTRFLTEFHKERYFGWEIREGNKTTWDYHFEYDFEDGKVQKYVRYDFGNPKDTVTYYYDQKGLLTKTQGYILEQFEYEYY